MDVRGYLNRLGIDDPGPPSVGGLRDLHRAHVERVPYENLEIQLRRPTTIDPNDSADRIVHRLHGRGGYCYHLNGAFSALLAALGYRVRWHKGGVQSGQDEPVGATGNHLALTVSDLPDRDSPDGSWFVDVGLGDALHEPVPLREGTYLQGPFRYSVSRSRVVPGGWRFDHDPGGTFRGMDFAPGPAAPADFAAMHEYLSNDPESGFVRAAVAQRRDATGVDTLRGCRLSRWDRSGNRTRDVTKEREWFEVLRDVFGLTLDDVAAGERAALWRRVRKAHLAWTLQQAAS